MSPTIAGFVPSPTMPVPDMNGAILNLVNGLFLSNTIDAPYPKYR